MDRETYNKASEIVSRIDTIEKELTRIRTRLDNYTSPSYTTVTDVKLVVKFNEWAGERILAKDEEEFKLSAKELIECLTNRANRLEEEYQRGISAFDKL